jgi:hypothetical protein
MKTVIVLSALALAAGASLRPAFAAHAGAPYANVDHKNDAGNDTGDSQVDQLNASQSDANFYRSHPAPPPGAVVIVPGR